MKNLWGVTAFFGVLIAVFLLARVWAPKLAEFTGGAEGEILTLLKKSERSFLEIPVPGETQKLTSGTHYFGRISVALDPSGDRATASATLDFTGRFGGTTVSSVGYENIVFVRGPDGWGPEAGYAPRLAAIVEALERRRRALEKADAAALADLSPGTSLPVHFKEFEETARRRFVAKAWYIRSQRAEVLATEEGQLSGETPAKPVDRLVTKQLVLTPRGPKFFFSGMIL